MRPSAPLISVRRRTASPEVRAWVLRAVLLALVSVSIPVSMFVFAGAATAQPVPSKPAPGGQLNQPTQSLFKAVELNDMTAVKSSIDAGADMFAENEDGMTAADLAVDKGHFIVAHYLLSRRLLGQTPPVALIPGKAKEAAKAAEAKPKRKFASPRPKPKAKPPAPAPEIAEAPKPMEPVRIEVTPAPPEAPPETPPEAPEGLETFVEIPASEIAEATGVVTDEVVEAAGAPEPDKPLAEQGFVSFFKSLVDLITPGGEKPPRIAGKTTPPETATGVTDAAAEDTPLTPEDAKEASLDETMVETVVEEPDEIIVDVTGDVMDGLEGEVIEEITGDTPLELVETDLETVTAVPDEEEKPKDAGKEDTGESFLDRLASLFTSDDKPGDDKPGDGKPGETGEELKPLAKTGEVREYDLPLPPSRPLPPKKMSPRFLDKLADFLETGDEEAFQAWLPKTQILNPKARRPQMAGPAPEIAAKPPVDERPLAEPPEPWSTAVKRPTADETVSETMAETVTAETEAEEPGMIQGVFNKLVDALTPDFGNRERPERLILEPEEKLAQVGKKGADDGEAVPKYWPITEVETAETPPLASTRPPRPLKTSLRGVTLTLGQSVSLENSFPPMGDAGGIDPYNQCVKKNRGTTLFCLETVDWPEEMQPDFLVPTILYTGQKAIARYDQGIASRFHALFPSKSFKRIALYFTERFGEPTDAWNRSIAPFAQPRQDNPILSWRSIDPKTQVVTILEIRKYDDSRGGFPDTNRGAVMLYLANSPPIFPQVSSHELMRISRARLGQLPIPRAPATGTPADIDASLEDGAPPGEAPPKKKALKDMTAEEIQADRRERKDQEAAGEIGGPDAAAPAQPLDESFDLPPDPLGR